jgi:two-component system, OmpR family, alkaline phosphatase synthesis response regulator PhoP
MARILVIEDEPDIQTLLQFNLQREGHQVTIMGSGEDGLHELRRHPYDLVLLDLMLPDKDGLEVCRIMRSDAHLLTIPIIMVTAKSEESDVVLGLGLGADDYVIKPFRVKELLARIKVRLAHTNEVESNSTKKRIQIGKLTIDPIRHSAAIGDDVVPLTLTEFKLLHFLATHPSVAYGRYDLLDRVSGGDSVVTDRTLDVHVRNLRAKIKPYDRLIETVRGVGYRFNDVPA